VEGCAATPVGSEVHPSVEYGCSLIVPPPRMVAKLASACISIVGKLVPLACSTPAA
jgi:hypothetical protein